MGTSQHLYLATHSEWRIKTQLQIQQKRWNYARYHRSVRVAGTELIWIAVCYYLTTKWDTDTSYHLSSRHLGQGTPPLPPPQPPPPRQVWCQLCCPQMNWCHPATAKRRPKASVQPVTSSFNITAAAVRYWKHTVMAQCLCSHYINARVGSYAWCDLLLEVFRL